MDNNQQRRKPCCFQRKGKRKKKFGASFLLKAWLFFNYCHFHFFTGCPYNGGLQRPVSDSTLQMSFVRLWRHRRKSLQTLTSHFNNAHPDSGNLIWSVQKMGSDLSSKPSYLTIVLSCFLLKSLSAVDLREILLYIILLPQNLQLLGTLNPKYSDQS